MDYDSDIIEFVDKIETRSYSGRVFRHIFGSNPPDIENTKGARWNPPDIPAIYTSLERDTCIAESQYIIDLQPIPTKAHRTIYTININLDHVVDFSSVLSLKNILPPFDKLADLSWEDCSIIGGAVERLGKDGMLVPSVRCEGVNLVIFPNKQTSNYRFDPVSGEIIMGIIKC